MNIGGGMQFQTTKRSSFQTIKYLFTAVFSTLIFLLSIQILQFSLATEVLHGTASWYGPNFVGKVTANGEVFNPRELTAAHQSLAFNTIVRVTNLRNGQSVDVRINDRGPFIDNRIIDLSEAAAEYIDMKYEGLAPVRLNIIQAGNPPLVIERVNLAKYEAAKLTTNTTMYPNSYNNQDVQQVSTSKLQYTVNQDAIGLASAMNSSSSTLNYTSSYAPSMSSLPLPTHQESPQETVASASTTITYVAMKNTNTEKHVTVSATSNTEKSNTFNVNMLAGLTLQEVIVSNYPVGTQFLIGSPNGSQLWVQVINNQLPPEQVDTFLVSKELLNILGKDLLLLEQQ